MAREDGTNDKGWGDQVGAEVRTHWKGGRHACLGGVCTLHKSLKGHKRTPTGINEP
jgi:hypothetical protein